MLGAAAAPFVAPGVASATTYTNQTITVHSSASTSYTNTAVTLSDTLGDVVTPPDNGVVTYFLDSGTNHTGDVSSAACTLTGTSLNATAAGTCYVYATIPATTNGSNSFNAATSADVTVTFTNQFTFTTTTSLATVTSPVTFGSETSESSPLGDVTQ